MYEGGPSPLAQIIKNEVNYFYSFILGKPIEEDGQE